MTEKRSFSYSKIRSYATCPGKYKKEYRQRIIPILKAKPLAYGSCMSSALAAYRIGGGLKEAKDAFAETWEEEGMILSIDADPDNPKDFRTVRRGYEMIKEYIDEYPDEHKLIAEPEIKFSLEIGEIEGIVIILNGRLDGVIEVGKDHAVIEDKTTSRLGPTYFDTLRGSLQILLYMWAADKLGLFKIGGVSKTPKCLMNAMRTHLTEFRFLRDIALKSRISLEQAKENALSWIRQILDAEDKDLFPLNDVDNETCKKYGGCEYLPFKYAHESVIENLMKTDFKIRRLKTTVVHHKEPYDILIDRTTKFGNPFRISEDIIKITEDTRKEVIKKYERWLRGKDFTDYLQIERKIVLDSLLELEGKVLGCWCKPEACHGDVLVKLINER